MKARIDAILPNFNSYAKNTEILEEIALYRNDSSKVPKFLQNTKVHLDKMKQNEVVQYSTAERAHRFLTKLHKEEWIWIKVLSQFLSRLISSKSH